MLLSPRITPAPSSPPATETLIVYELDPTGNTWLSGQVVEAPPGENWEGAQLDMEGDLLIQTLPAERSLLAYRTDSQGQYQRVGMAEPEFPAAITAFGRVRVNDNLAHLAIPQFTDPLTGSMAGRVLVFGQDSGGGSWSQLQELSPQDLPTPAAPAGYSRFGVSAGRLVIGQTDPQLIGGLATGRLVQYQRNAGAGAPWIPAGVLERDVLDELDTLGLNVALEGSQLVTSYEVYDGATRRVGRVFELGGADRNGDGVTDTCQMVGAPYCNPAVPNSSGLAARLQGLGSASVSENQLDLCVFELPTMEFGYLLASSATAFTPSAGSSIGNLCLAGGPDFGRYTSFTQSSGAGGAACVPIDLTSIPTAIGPIGLSGGDTWYFQYWYRDGVSSNFTAGLEVTLE